MMRGSSVLLKVTKQKAAADLGVSLYTINRIFGPLSDEGRVLKYVLATAPVISGEMVTVAEAAKRLNKRPRVINKYISEHKLATYTVLGSPYICLEQLEYLITNTK